MQDLGIKWGFPKIMGTFLGVPIIRIIVYWGLYWGPPILGNYQMSKTICMPQTFTAITTQSVFRIEQKANVSHHGACRPFAQE